MFDVNAIILLTDAKKYDASHPKNWLSKLVEAAKSKLRRTLQRRIRVKDSVETLEKVVALLQRELAFKPPVWRNAQGQCVEAYCWMDPVNMTLEHTPWEFPPKWMFDVVSIVPNGVALVNGIDVPAGDIVVRWYDGAIKVYTLEQFKAEFTKV